MKEFVRAALQWFADSRLARSVVDTIFRGRARRRIVELDHQSLARSQNRTLLGLVHRAHTTRFGRDHDFLRIQTPRDFQRLVPLRTPAELWREYWQPAFPNLAGATWPGPIPYLAISSGQASGSFPYIPVSPELWAAQQTAALTSLAFVMHARPRSRLCSGRLCLLGGGTTLTPLADPEQADSVEAIAIRELPALLQPYAYSLTRQDSQADALSEVQLLQDLAERSLGLPVTCIAGTAERVLRFVGDVKRVAGRDRLADIWPGLAAVLYARGAVEPDRARLAGEIASPGVLCLEMYFRPEGAIAVEDPRQQRLRLLPDHGVYFEFVPLDQVGRPRPERHSAADVKLGVPYALALSSPAGIWACLVGSVVRFERRDPPLLRLVETRMLWEPARLPEPPPLKTAVPAHAFPSQPPHPRPIGSPVLLPGKPFRNAQSVRAERE
jgi:GH3 auxin-responsive promoter